MEDRYEYLKIQSLRKALEEEPTHEELRNVRNQLYLIDDARQVIRELFKHLKIFGDNLKNFDSVDQEEFEKRSSQLKRFAESLEGMMKLWNNFNHAKNSGDDDRLMNLFLNRKEFREGEKRMHSICNDLKGYNNRFQEHKIPNEEDIDKLFEWICKLTAWHTKVLHLIETEHGEHISTEISKKFDKMEANPERISMDDFHRLVSSFVPSVNNVFNNYGQVQYNKGNNLGDFVFGNKYNTRIDSLFDIQGNYYNKYVEGHYIKGNGEITGAYVKGDNNSNIGNNENRKLFGKN